MSSPPPQEGQVLRQEEISKPTGSISLPSFLCHNCVMAVTQGNADTGGNVYVTKARRVGSGEWTGQPLGEELAQSHLQSLHLALSSAWSQIIWRPMARVMARCGTRQVGERARKIERDNDCNPPVKDTWTRMSIERRVERWYLTLFPFIICSSSTWRTYSWSMGPGTTAELLNASYTASTRISSSILLR